MEFDEYTKELEVSKIDAEFYPCLKFSVDCVDSIDDVATPLLASVHYTKNKTELNRLYLSFRHTTTLRACESPCFFIKMRNTSKWGTLHKEVCGHCVITNSHTEMLEHLTTLGRVATGNKRRSVICKPCATFFPLLQTFMNRYYEQGRVLPAFKKPPYKTLYTDYD